MTSWLYALCLAGALDWLYADYTMAVQARKAHRAGAMAGILYVVGGLLTLGVVADPFTLIPAGAGAYLGTALAVKRAKPNGDGPAH